MSETQAKPSLALQRIYVKDLSFESPQSPECFSKAWKPNINLELKTRYNKIDDTHFEVIINTTVNAKIEDKTAFLIELQQAGIFAITGIEEKSLDRVLGTICPNTLFPYARENIDSVLNRGSFPPIMLAPINFDALYNEIQKRKEKQATEETAAVTN